MLELTLKTGEPARLVQAAGDKLSIESPLSSPPGSTVYATVEGVACEFQLKVQRCRKLNETHYQIDGRLRNATRELQAKIQAAAQNASS